MTGREWSERETYHAKPLLSLAVFPSPLFFYLDSPAETGGAVGIS